MATLCSLLLCMVVYMCLIVVIGFSLRSVHSKNKNQKKKKICMPLAKVVAKVRDCNDDDDVDKVMSKCHCSA